MSEEHATAAHPWVRIREAGSHVGQQVEIRGWVTHRRSSGKVQFLVIRDGSGSIQCVAGVKDLSPEQWEATAQLTTESAVIVRGLVKTDARQVGGVAHRRIPAVALHVPATPGDRVEAKKDGFVVTRSLTWLHRDGSSPTHHEDQSGGAIAVAQGDVLEVHARLTSDQARSQVALVVPFAAGLEPLNPALANAGSDATPSETDTISATYTQRLDHEVRYYFTELAAGSYSFHFRVRASNEGSFVHPAPYAEMMYREAVRGRGAGMRVNIKGAHEK